VREPAGESAWVSVHAFYHDGLDVLLVHVVASLVEELSARGLAGGFFFLRYWDDVRHLRLRVLPAGKADRASVEGLIAERFDEYFARHSAAERVYPTNSLAFIPYRREHGRYGHGVSIEAVERHFVESSRIALVLLTAGLTAGQRATAAAAMILLAWFSGEPDPARLTGWVNASPPAGRPDPQATFDPAGLDTAALDTAGRLDRMIELARRMRALAARSAELPGDRTLVGWARSMTTLRDALTAQIASGAFTPPAGYRHVPAEPTPHGSSPSVLPVLDICAHLACNRLGVGPAEERTLRYRAAWAVAALADEGSRAGGPARPWG